MLEVADFGGVSGGAFIGDASAIALAFSAVLAANFAKYPGCFGLDEETFIGGA